VNQHGSTPPAQYRKHGALHALFDPMKAISESLRSQSRDYYTSTIAPIDCHLEVRFRALDAVLLSVLFLEVLGLMRLLLAN
jgi:hypothetical protein